MAIYREVEMFGIKCVVGFPMGEHIISDAGEFSCQVMKWHAYLI